MESSMSPRIIPWFLVLAAATAQADEPVGYQDGLRLMQKYHCQQCHAVDKSLSGPSLRAIAKRYVSDPNARDEVAANILNGSIGAWGPLPMSPVQVSQEDLRRLVDWILSLTPS
jgi:cytochrome c